MSETNKTDLPERKYLGEILVERHVITKDQLNQALKVQKKEKLYIGEILIKLGYLEERDIVVALVVQCNLPYIAIDKYSVDQKIISLLTQEFMRENHVFPLDRVGDVLSIVMANPLNQTVTSEIKQLTGCQVAPFIATRAEIEHAISLWFDK